MTQTIQTNLGDLISLFYDEFVGLYGDEELASVAAAAVINELLHAAELEDQRIEDAA
jgi:hypothetical protein